MAAIDESATADVFQDVGHGTKDVIEFQVGEAKLLKARRVDHATLGAVQIIKRRGRGRLSTKVQGLRIFLRASFGAFDQEIQNGGLAHAGLPDQKRALTVKNAVEFGDGFCGAFGGREAMRLIAQGR